MPSMNNQQLEAVSDNSKNILVIAGAGTGKTYVMIQRIKRLVNEGVDPSSILALTFTNAAAFEMRERYRRLEDLLNSNAFPEFKTFHAFCYGLINSNREILNKIGYANVPNIVEEVDIKRIKNSIKLKYNIKLNESQLNNPDKLNPKDKLSYDIYEKSVNLELSKQNVITFDMLIQRVCNLFIQNDSLISEYIDKYKYIFIDEFQDTDPLQWKFAQCFKDSNLFVVGDALQSIYSFRNADSSIIKGLSDNPDWKVIKLFENYRSTDKIVDFANMHSKYADSKYRIELHSQTKSIQEVLVSFNMRENRYTEYSPSLLSNAAQYCISNKGSSAILVRTNQEVSWIDTYLTSQNVPHSLNAVNKDAVNTLKSCLDSTYLINWCASFLRSDKYADFIRIEALKSSPDEDKMAKLNRFIQCFGGNPIISEHVNKIFQIRNVLKSDELPFVKCNSILGILSIKNISVDTSATTPAEIVNYLISEVSKKAESNIYVGTIHSSKGLEYETVVLLGVDGPSFKLDSEENKNLYYVGITRARSNLMVSIG